MALGKSADANVMRVGEGGPGLHPGHPGGRHRVSELRKLMCNYLDKEYSERTQTWTEKIPAVQEAFGTLTDDDVRDLFSMAWVSSSSRAGPAG